MRDQPFCIVAGEITWCLGGALENALDRRPPAMVLTRRASDTEILGLLTRGACGAVVGRADAPPPVTPPVTRHCPELSERELDVLRHVANGLTNRDTASQLGVSALTVKSHLARISRKLGSGDRASLVAIAMRADLLQ